MKIDPPIVSQSSKCLEGAKNRRDENQLEKGNQALTPTV